MEELSSISSVHVEQAEFPVARRGYDRAAVDRFRTDVARALAAYEIELGVLEPVPAPDEAALDAAAAEAAKILEAALREFNEIVDDAEGRVDRTLESQQVVSDRLARLRSVLEDAELDVRRAMASAVAEINAVRTVVSAALRDGGGGREEVGDGFPAADIEVAPGATVARGPTVIVDLRDPVPAQREQAPDQPGAYERRLAGLRDRLDGEEGSA